MVLQRVSTVEENGQLRDVYQLRREADGKPVVCLLPGPLIAALNQSSFFTFGKKTTDQRMHIRWKFIGFFLEFSVAQEGNKASDLIKIDPSRSSHTSYVSRRKRKHKQR